MGMSDKLWKSLNEDERQPLYNRFRQVWCPGSTFKPVTAVIGLDTGILDPVEDYGNEGLSWQKDSSWGDYYVTTLHETEPATLENAMIYSDNIYFAKVALKLGENNLTSFLEKLGFNKEIPFDIKMSISQYSNTEGIKSEIQLADSGYGQGQILINPLHLASIYSAFSNDGIGPWNRIQQFQPFPEVVNCIENEDGSLTLTVEAVFQEEGTDCSFRHEVTIREEGDKWIYLGNCIEREGAYKIPEYKPRRDF